jgi:hypothetical protein
MITRTTAALLYGHGYKLVDKEGRQYGVQGAIGKLLFVYGSMSKFDKHIKFDQIGTDFWILSRPISQLTHEIEPGVVPIRHLCKIIYQSLYDDDDFNE